MSRELDLEGKKFGYLTAIKKVTVDGRQMWECKCDCGNITYAYAGTLNFGGKKSCGCLYRDKYNKKYKDLTGKRFGRLTVIGPIKHDNRLKWECLCDCGNKNIVTRNKLESGHTTSCGCYVVESSRKIHTKHGKRGLRVYNIWATMVDRCRREKCRSYKDYGGRGIKVCEEWQTFEPFYEWAMSHGYADDLTIDRIDVNGNYEPSNCRWATTDVQARNRRDNVFLTLNGETKCLTDWSRSIGISEAALSRRISKGWPIEIALTTPPLPVGKKLMKSPLTRAKQLSTPQENDQTDCSQ